MSISIKMQLVELEQKIRRLSNDSYLKLLEKLREEFFSAGLVMEAIRNKALLEEADLRLLLVALKSHSNKEVKDFVEVTKMGSLIPSEGIGFDNNSATRGRLPDLSQYDSKIPPKEQIDSYHHGIYKK